jgi:hypothetical protein
MQANPHMSILTTDLIYGNQPSYLFHYMAASANSGTIMSNFKSEAAKFRPIHQADVTAAVAHSLTATSHGHFGLYGQQEHSIGQLLAMVEGAVGKNAGAKNAWISSITSLADDFFVGTTHEGNFDAMMAHYAEHGCTHHQLQCFFEAAGLQHLEHDVARFFRTQGSVDTDSLNEPASWKFASLD